MDNRPEVQTISSVSLILYSLDVSLFSDVFSNEFSVRSLLWLIASYRLSNSGFTPLANSWSLFVCEILFYIFLFIHWVMNEISVHIWSEIPFELTFRYSMQKMNTKIKWISLLNNYSKQQSILQLIYSELLNWIISNNFFLTIIRHNFSELLIGFQEIFFMIWKLNFGLIFGGNKCFFASIQTIIWYKFNEKYV